MTNPAWITSENVKFNGTADNAAVLKTADDIRTLILWDDLSTEDKSLLTNFIDQHGAALPLAGATAGYQFAGFDKKIIGSSATGLDNVSAATAGISTIDIGGDKVGGDTSGLSSAVGTAGSQIVNFSTTIAAGTSTELVPTAGYQTVNVGGAKVGGNPTGLAVDAAGYQTVNVGGAKVGGDATGLAADTAGYQTVNVGGAKVGGDATGLANDATTYTASINVDGVAKAISVVGSAAQTFTDLLTEINTDLAAAATITIEAGNLKVTSATTGGASSVAITDTDLFATLTGYVAIPAAVAGTSTTYTASISVDGVAKAISVVGNAAQTFTDLLTEINTDLAAAATIAISGGNLRVTSATTGVTSIVAITDTDLFAALTGYVAILTAVDGTATATYTASISVDGVAKAISVVGNAAQTFTDLLTEINTDLAAAATIAISGGNLRVTSATLGTTSLVAITDTDLFASLTGYVAIPAAVAGTKSTAALTATVVVDGVTKNISILPTAITTFADVITELNTDLGVAATAAIAGGDIKITSATLGTSSTVDITAGTLFPALPGYAYLLPAQDGDSTARTYSATVVVDGTLRTVRFLGTAGTTLTDVVNEINADLATAASSGYQVVKFMLPKIGSHPTGLANNGTAYLGEIEVDGVAKAISVTGSTAQTFTNLIAQINTDLDATATIAIVDGNLKITSATTGASSTVEITNDDIFGALAGYVSTETEVDGADAVTYATASVATGDLVITSESTGVNSSVIVYDTGALFSSLTDYAGIVNSNGVAPKIYTATITVDGVAKAISIQGSAAQTFTNLVTQLNTDLGAAATASLAPAATAGYQVVNFSETKAGGDATGLANDATAYTATITVDGVAKAISVVGSAAQTFTTLLNEINTDLAAAATIAISGGNLRVTSATTGIASLVSITAGTLFPALTDYSALATAVVGVGSNIKITSATTGLSSIVSIHEGNLFDAISGYKGLQPSINGITDLVEAAKKVKSPNGTSIYDSFDVKRVGTKPAVPTNTPHSIDFVYWNGTVWKYLDDDTNV
ncbi:MAG: beta strand repeat-containing protein [Nitrososphaeraceae archaeon]